MPNADDHNGQPPHEWTKQRVREIAAHTLSDRQLQAWRLRAEGFTWEFIALVMLCSTRTAREHYDRANQRILEAMTKAE